MSSSSTKIVVVCFTLALLVASYGGAAACERTGVPCNGSDAMCAPYCKGKPAYCSTEHVVGDPSCVCGRDCAAAPRDEPALEKPATATTAGRRGMGMLH